MGDHMGLILEFGTRDRAQACLDAINIMAAGWGTAQGYTIVNADDHPERVGKNAANGQERMDACRTTTWAEIRESPDGTFYFPSPLNNPHFSDWQNKLPEGTDRGIEKMFPALWAPLKDES